MRKVVLIAAAVTAALALLATPASGRWLDMRVAKAAAFDYAKHRFQDAQRKEAGHELIFHTVLFTVDSCTRQAPNYVLCIYSLYKEPSPEYDAPRSQCLNRVGVFLRSDRSRRPSTEVVGSQLCLDE